MCSINKSIPIRDQMINLNKVWLDEIENPSVERFRWPDPGIVAGDKETLIVRG